MVRVWPFPIQDLTWSPKPALLQPGDDRGESALAAVAEYLAQHDRNHSRFELAERALERR